MDGHRNCLVIDDDKIALKLAATCCHELGLKVYIADTPAEAFDANPDYCDDERWVVR